MKPRCAGASRHVRVLVALATPLILILPACFVPRIPVAANVTRLECIVTVRGGDAENPFEQELTSGGPEFLPENLEPRNYTLTTDCADGFGFETREEAEADYRTFTAERIERLAEEDPASVFALLGGSWCEVPGTLRCEDRVEITQCLEIGDELVNEPLPLCPDPPAPPGCLAVTCNGADCMGIDYGTLELPASAGVDVTVENCGETGAPDIEINYDGTVIPIDVVDGLAEFVVPLGTNGCFDPDGSHLLAAGESCGFEARFEPLTPGVHDGRTEISYQFVDDPLQRSASIDLDGVADGRQLTLSPAVDLCFDQLTDPVGVCTAAQQLTVSNQGSEALTLDCVGFDLDNNPAQCPAYVTSLGFEVQSEGGVALPATMAPGAQDTLRLRWCGPAADEPQTTFELRSNDRNQPILSINVERRVACP